MTVGVYARCGHYTITTLPPKAGNQWRPDQCMPCHDRIYNDPDPHVNGTCDCYCCCRCHNSQED